MFKLKRLIINDVNIKRLKQNFNPMQDKLKKKVNEMTISPFY
jgi:hypothetical protein